MAACAPSINTNCNGYAATNTQTSGSHLSSGGTRLCMPLTGLEISSVPLPPAAPGAASAPPARAGCAATKSHGSPPPAEPRPPAGAACAGSGQGAEAPSASATACLALLPSPAQLHRRMRERPCRAQPCGADKIERIKKRALGGAPHVPRGFRTRTTSASRSYCWRSRARTRAPACARAARQARSPPAPVQAPCRPPLAQPTQRRPVRRAAPPAAAAPRWAPAGRLHRAAPAACATTPDHGRARTAALRHLMSLHLAPCTLQTKSTLTRVVCSFAQRAPGAAARRWLL